MLSETPAVRTAAPLGCGPCKRCIKLTSCAPRPTGWSPNSSSIAWEAAHRPNAHFFSALVRDASARQAEIDELIGGALPANWPITRLELVLLAILRCGVGELSSPHEVPPKVTISEYVDIAHGFLDAKGAAMVNAVLDRLARTLRGGELDAQADPTR